MVYSEVIFNLSTTEDFHKDLLINALSEIGFDTFEDFEKDSKKLIGRVKPRKEWDSVLTLPHGAGYFYLRAAFKKYFGFIKQLAPRIIFVAHLRDKNINKEGKDVGVMGLNLTGKVRDIIASKSDAVGYVYRSADNNLRISFKTSENIQCGNRAEHLAGQEFDFTWEKIYV